MIPKLVIKPLTGQRGSHMELGKRVHVPVVAESTCPNCGNSVEINLSEGGRYLYYAVTNVVDELSFSHDCPDGTTVEWAHKIIVRLTIEAVGEEGR